jgi:putative CocE/NonD family hydrolase
LSRYCKYKARNEKYQLKVYLFWEMKQALFLIFFFPLTVWATDSTDSTWLYQHYIKTEVNIPMRDGINLFTAAYTPKDNKEKHPILINRTPYSIAPYGKDSFKAYWKNHYLQYFKEGYIIVLQDVRGTYMSEGNFEDVRPYNEHKKGKKDIDEASDTYDTIEWLLANVKNNNGKVGVFGVSYPGFYSTMAALSQHPAVKAVSPQAPVTEWFIGDDFHHNGAFMLMDAFSFYSSFGKPRRELRKIGAKGFEFKSQDNYDFYLNAGTMKDFGKLMGDSITFWQELYKHPDYDKWWQIRNTRAHVQHIPKGVATLVVGGLFDAEDCYGAWNLYKAIEQKTVNDNRLVMGPWSHGGWSKGTGEYLGNVRFGSKTAEWYQQHMEIPFFNYHLKDKGSISEIKEANIFITGANKWESFDSWPPVEAKEKAIYLGQNAKLSWQKPGSEKSFSKYTSNPAKPVPYTEDIHFGRTKEYMTDDQRFAARRTDVLVFETEILEKDLKIAGPVIADLFTSISTTDADFVVKIIDVFPDELKYTDSINGKGEVGKSYPMGGYQMLVRGEIMRGRYRNSFEKPEAFEPGKITNVKYSLPDVAHVFKKGHKLMVQIQSSWFPLADRNPQQFVNIYTADREDFIKSTIKIYHDKEHPSRVILPIIN